ncbi:MAG TPA: hypothetical protein VHV54_07175 [Candidatus Binatia bacterium]|jgi:hypothetical protein|nr:hypothetical protein [Candidatus Binatia bacterium]
MSVWRTDPESATDLRNRRLGIALAALAVLYIAAVIAFIIIY